jgi:hypothetical protein
MGKGIFPLLIDVTKAIRAYAVEQFTSLRGMFGITEKAFRKSLLESGPYVSFQSNSKGAARAGAIFFFSRDGAFLVKSIKRDEGAALLHVLPKYCSFMKGNGQRSLLTRFCGMYDVCFGGKCWTLVVMNAVFPAGSSQRLSEIFDLKGSSVGRESSEEERKERGRKAVLKDLDLVRESMAAHGVFGGQSKGFSVGPLEFSSW